MGRREVFIPGWDGPVHILCKTQPPRESEIEASPPDGGSKRRVGRCVIARQTMAEGGRAVPVMCLQKELVTIVSSGEVWSRNSEKI